MKGGKRMAMTTTLTWVFIVLFSGILFIYFRNLTHTLQFWKKQRPKNPDHHWKNRFSIIDHLTLTTEKKRLIQTGGAFVVLLLLLHWSQRDNDTQLYSLMVVTFFFACLMITREFPQHIFLYDNKLTAWSVHSTTFPLIKDLPYSMVYKATITKKDIVASERTRFGYIFTLKEARKLYVRSNFEQSEYIEKWIGK